MAKQKTTKKKGDIIVLPGNTEIYQSNRITNGKFQGFNGLHMKILINTIKQLQVAITTDMAGKEWQQLDIFNQAPEGMFRIGIHLSDITTPVQYKEAILAGRELTTISVKLKSTIDGKQYNSTGALFLKFHDPVKVSGKSMVYIDIAKENAQAIIEIDKRADGKPMQFTKYLYEVAMNARSKYTPKMYMIISSWKLKGGFRIVLNELQKQLGIEETEYMRYDNFKKRVLLPIQNDLEKKSDCWFNCRAADFEVREGKQVVALNFKIIVPEFEEKENEKKDYIRQMLKMHFRFDDTHLKYIAPIFENWDANKFTKITTKIVEIRAFIHKVMGSDEQIKDIAAYTASSLLKTFVL